jgi:hypothetical protein
MPRPFNQMNHLGSRMDRQRMRNCTNSVLVNGMTPG